MSHNGYISRCYTCPGHAGGANPGTPIILESGPSPSPFLFLGAGPSKNEMPYRRPYSGRAGEELDVTYLSRAGFTRADVAVGNATLCWDGQLKPPSEKRVLDCAGCHLPALLDRLKPEVVVLMGGVTQAICDRRPRLDMHHGRPQRNSLLGGQWEGWVVPMYEPALGMRETARMTQLLEDFETLGRWAEGEWTPPAAASAEETERDYGAIRDVYELKDYCGRYGGRDELPVHVGAPVSLSSARPSLVAVDTETHGRATWSLQFSLAPHSGRLIRSDRPEVMSAFQDWTRATGAEFILHNAPQDLDTLERMGVVPSSSRDTMQEAFRLCSLPQGLKPLAYRLLGITMTSWQETVWPASVALIQSWMWEAYAMAEEGLAEVEVTPLVRGRCVDCGHQHTKGPCKRCKCTSTRVTFKKSERKAGAIEKILRHVIGHTDKGADNEKPYNPWEAIEKMREDGLRGAKGEGWEWDYLQEALGPIPILGIGNCEFEAAVRYGCGDADVTGQVETVLEQRRQGPEWIIPEWDWDR